jgi:hypothetical protein
VLCSRLDPRDNVLGGTAEAAVVMVGCEKVTTTSVTADRYAFIEAPVPDLRPV